MELKDKVIAITGGASGLGEASTRHFVTQGAKVMILDINDDNAKAICDELGDESVKYVNTNIMEEEPVKDAMSKIEEAFGKLHVAINCAGTGYGARIIGKDAPHPLDHFKFIIDLNLVGTFNVMRLAAELMDKNEADEDGEKGVIINTASIAGYEGQIGQAAYSASKGGVVGMTLPIARDLSVAGIRVLTIAPGTFDTPMLGMLPEEIRQAIANGIPFPKLLGDPAQYAHLVEHMVQNSYMNGETVRLDGALRLAPK
mgnify:CR=1 FL=1